MLIFLLLSFFSQANPGNDSITLQELKSHVYFLASEELAGREAGSKEERLAAEYLACELASWGFKPGGDQQTFFQSFEAKNRSMRNVIGWLAGTDEQLKEEYLIIGGHYDHLGWGGPGSPATEKMIHNGADDNASGVAAVLEIAQALALNPPKRSVVVIFFSGEEKGLLGSKYYCEDPKFPLEKTVTMINCDMLGQSRDHYLFVGGVGTGTGLKKIVMSEVEKTPLQVETAPGGLAPSDNMAFFKNEVPVLFFFTHIHDDYHAPGDDWWKVNYEAHLVITRLVYRVADMLANQPHKPEYQYENSMAVPKDFREKMMKLIMQRMEAKKGK